VKRNYVKRYIAWHNNNRAICPSQCCSQNVNKCIAQQNRPHARCGDG